MATNAVFLAAVQALRITGAARHFAEPPAQVTTADLPAVFPLLPSGVLGEKSLSCFDNNKTRAIRLVVAIEAAGQGTQPQNYGKLAAMMDNMETKLDDLEKSQGGTLAAFVEYEIAADLIAIGENDYWGVVADIRTRDA